MNINDYFEPSKYLKAGDLKDARLPITVRIARVEQELVGQDKKRKPVVYFVGKDKGMVLNRTNAAAIAAMARTDDTHQWRDLTIGLDVHQVPYQSEIVPALRVVRPARVHPHQTPRAADAAGAPAPARPARSMADAGSWGPPPDREPGDDVDEDIPF